jgi:hypothetical protein
MDIAPPSSGLRRNTSKKAEGVDYSFGSSKLNLGLASTVIVVSESTLTYDHNIIPKRRTVCECHEDKTLKTVVTISEPKFAKSK